MPNIFSRPGRETALSLQQAARAIDRAFPLKRRHLAELPYAVRDLSRLLTTERSQKQAYWSSPKFMGAYLRYFLPWNLLRLSRLLPSLPLDLPPEAKVLDLGSGPLTLPLGLWLARPDLRKRPLELICADTAPRPMELGRDIYRLLASEQEAGSVDKPNRSERAIGRIPERQEATESADVEAAPVKNPEAADARQDRQSRERLPWQIRLTRDPLEVAIRKTRGKVRLITAANVLNELPTPRQESLEQKLASIFDSMNRILEPGGQILLIEPGTRLGGKLIELMRRLALERGYSALAPCTHQEACPLLAERDGDEEDGSDDHEFLPGGSALRKAEAMRGARQAGQSGQTGQPASRQTLQPWQPRPSGWCHFSHDTDGAWPELLRLSAAADLPKERLSLSFVLLAKPLPGEGAEAGKRTESAAQARAGKTGAPAPGQRAVGLPQPGERMNARVVSEDIRVPGKGICRYVCTRAGLGLLRDAAGLPSGAEIEVSRPKNGGVDPKTGAFDLI